MLALSPISKDRKFIVGNNSNNGKNPSEVERQEIFNLYKTNLEQNNLPYVIVSGTGDERTENAIRSIQKFLKFEINNS